MAFDANLVERVRELLVVHQPNVAEQKMMGGITFMVNDKMCVGVKNDDLMCRIHPDAYEQSLQRPACRPMTMGGKAMKGYVFIAPEGTASDEDLRFWVELALAFNPFAQASKKKKTA